MNRGGPEQTRSSEDACAFVRMAGNHWRAVVRGRRALVSGFGRELKPAVLPTRISSLESSHGSAGEVSSSGRTARMGRKSRKTL